MKIFKKIWGWLKWFFPFLQKKEGIPEMVDYSNKNYKVEFLLTQQLFKTVSDYRESIGVQRVKQWEPASIEATNHSFYMATNGLSHDLFFERSDRLKRDGCFRVAENVCVGDKDPKKILELILSSATHKKTLEDPNFNYMGLGVVSRGKLILITQLMIQRL